MATLTKQERKIVTAIGQTIFPPDKQGITDAIDADILGYVDKWVGDLQPWEKAQVRAMFQLFEFGIAVEKLRPSLRITNATLTEREEYLRGWMESPIYARKMAFNALRSVFTLAYLGSARVSEELKISLGDKIDRDPMPHLKQLAGLAGKFGDESGEKIPAYQNVPLGFEQDKKETAPFTEQTKPAGGRAEGAHEHPQGGVFLPKLKNLYEWEDYSHDIVEQCDFVVVGSGPGGALIAHYLAEAGRDVVLVEAGPTLRREQFLREAGHTLTKYYWDSGLRTTRGNVIMPTLQPKALGGGTVFNSAICLRIPEYQLDRWSYENGITGMSLEDMRPHYEAVEEFMGVKPVDDDVQGPRNELFRQACEAVGLNAKPIKRNEFGCKGSGRCNLGCPNGAKLSTDLRGVPEVLSKGGRVYTCASVERVLRTGSRARGIEAVIRHPVTGEKKGTLKVFAKATILAAGTMATPVILQKSGFNRQPIGANLRMHPATVVAGTFREDVLPWYGASQGYHTLDLLKEGIKLESLWADAALMAFRVPGMGARFKKHVSEYRHIATWDAWVSGDSSVGRVQHVPGLPRPNLTYDLGKGDVRRLQAATIKLSEMFFAAGAKSVYPGIDGLPERIRRPRDLDRFREADVSPQELPAASNHVFGGMSMGEDPDVAATNSRGAVHFTDDVYVCDTSLYPSTPSANPMLPIMAIAHKMAGEIHENY